MAKEPQEYKVIDVKPWNGDEHPVYGKKFSISLEGYGEPVDITAKKYPVKGEIEYGVIEDYKTKNGTVRTKFTRAKREDAPQEPKPAQTVSKPDEAYWQSKNDHIKAQMAVKAAVNLYACIPETDSIRKMSPIAAVEFIAKELSAVVDRVAGSTSVAEEQPETGYEKAKKVAEELEAKKLATSLDNGEPFPVDTTDYSQPINLEDIPF